MAVLARYWQFTFYISEARNEPRGGQSQGTSDSALETFTEPIVRAVQVEKAWSAVPFSVLVSRQRKGQGRGMDEASGCPQDDRIASKPIPNFALNGKPLTKYRNLGIITLHFKRGGHGIDNRRSTYERTA